MKSVGIDLHKRNSYVTIMDEDGTILRQAKIPSEKESFRAIIE